MAVIRLTKNELRDQESKLTQLDKYLPTLQLKKALLQIEVNSSQTELEKLEAKQEQIKEKVFSFANLLSVGELDPISLVQVENVNKVYENIAGVDIPLFEGVDFKKEEFFLFDTPVWLDSALKFIKELFTIKENIQVVTEKKEALEKELREVSIRVNLFEKVLIPRCKMNIKKIKVFLGDQFLAAVSQAKVAKQKIEAGEAL